MSEWCERTRKRTNEWPQMCVPFLDAPSHLYKRLCPSVRPSPVIFKRDLGASCAVYPALFAVLNLCATTRITNNQGHGSKWRFLLVGFVFFLEAAAAVEEKKDIVGVKDKDEEWPNPRPMDGPWTAPEP